MFQNLASYLLSSVLNQRADANTTTGEGVEEDSSIRLTSKEENEWIIVDRDSEGNSETGSIRSLDDVDEDFADFRQVGDLTRTSSTSSLPPTTTAATMDESWFVTPPPCFTSTGPVIMRTSPLENLLIEHPSMSVYHINPRRNYAIRAAQAQVIRSAEVETEVVEERRRSSVREDEVVVEEERQGTGRVRSAVEARLPRLGRVQALRQQEAQYLKSKQAQKVQVQKACKAINRGKLQRNNKAREVNCRNQRHRRKERSQGATRSYASNNRKC